MICKLPAKMCYLRPYKHVLLVAILTIDKSITTDGIATENVNTVVIILTTGFSVPIWRSTDVN